MTDPSPFTPEASGEPAEPLALLLTERPTPSAFASARASRFEFSSRGDRVSGRLLLPDPRSGPCPLLLLLGDAGAGCDAAAHDIAAGWLADGFAVATVDLSLHGERSSRKFSERLIEAITAQPGEPALDANGQALLIEFTRQTVSDLSRVVDALGELPAIDAERVGLMGVGYGASLAAIFAADEPRVRAVVFAQTRAPQLEACDPAPFAQRIAPRALLELENETAGEEAGRFFAQALQS